MYHLTIPVLEAFAFRGRMVFFLKHLMFNKLVFLFIQTALILR